MPPDTPPMRAVVINEVPRGQRYPTHRRAGVVMAVAASALLCLGLVGALYPGGYVLIRTLLDHPVVFFGAAVALGTVGSWISVGTRRWRVVCAIASALLLASLAWWLAVSPMFEYELNTVAARAQSPDGRTRVTVHEGAAMIDPLWKLEIRRGVGIGARVWEAGCLNGDDPDNSFVSLRWQDNRTISVSVEDGRVLTVRLDPESGRPLNHVTTGAGC